MKTGFRLNQIAVVALAVVSAITLSAMAFEYSGLIELQCNKEGCRFVIDGRPSSD